MHLNTSTCVGCEAKLAQVDATLADWVRSVRGQHPDCHVAVGYRGEEDQYEAWKAGKSNAQFGQSPHNLNPSKAVDLFRLTQAGGAAFETPWYRDIIKPLAAAAGLVWGGDWKSLKDYDHFELPNWKP